jgi:hypothetical protein
MASTSGLPDIVSQLFTVNPAAATQLVFTTAPPSSTTAGAAIAVQLTAHDAFGNTATGFTGQVTLTLGPSGTLGGTTTASAVAGIATFANLSIQQAGSGYAITAAASGIPNVVSPSFTVNPGAAAQIVFTTAPPASTTAGTAIAVQLTARDAFGNTATSFTGPVMLTLLPSGTLGGTTTVNAVEGIATFTSLVIEQAATGYTLTASVAGIADAVSPSFTVSPGAAVQLAFTTAPGTTTAGAPIMVQLTARDSFGNTATSFTGAVTLGLGPSGTLGGTTTIDAVGGIATFADLTIEQAATDYVITASASGMANVVSPSFAVNPGVAAELEFTIPPTSTTAGTTMPVQLMARDAFGNTATGFTGNMTLTLGPSGTLGGTTTVNAVGGIATFADLTIEQAATGYTLTA